MKENDQTRMDPYGKLFHIRHVYQTLSSTEYMPQRGGYISRFTVTPGSAGS